MSIRASNTDERSEHDKRHGFGLRVPPHLRDILEDGGAIPFHPPARKDEPQITLYDDHPSLANVRIDDPKFKAIEDMRADYLVAFRKVLARMEGELRNLLGSGYEIEDIVKVFGPNGEMWLEHARNGQPLSGKFFVDVQCDGKSIRRLAEAETAIAELEGL